MSDPTPAHDERPDGAEEPDKWSGRKVATPFIVMAVLAGGCMALISVSDDSGSSNAERPAIREVAPEDRYVQWMRQRVDGAESRSDAEIISGGRELCAVMDDMESSSDLQLAGTIAIADYGYSAQELADAMVGAANTLCPANKHLLD